MSGPWELYQSSPAAASSLPASDGPWTLYGGSATPQSVPTAHLAPAANQAPPSSDSTTTDALNAVEGTGAANYDTGDARPLTIRGAAKPTDTASPGVLQQIDAGVRAAANGATLGFADRIAAGMGALTGVGGAQGDYAGNLAGQQAETQQEAKAYPVTTTAAGMAGALAMPAGEGVAAIAAQPTIAGKLAAGAGLGAGFGAAQGAASSPDLTNAGDTAQRAFSGAKFGATVGAAIPGVASGAGSAYRAVAGRVAGLPEGVNSAAASKLTDAMNADPGAMDRLQQLGPDALLPDAGPSLLGLAQGVATKPGEGRTVLTDALTNRDKATNARVNADVNTALGPAQPVAPVRQMIDDAGSAVAQPYFAKAYAAGAPWTSELEELSQRPAIASALQDAAKTAANEGRPLPTVTLDAAGNQVGPQAPLEAAQAATRPAVDQALGALLGNQGGSIGTAQQIMDARASQAAPLYDAARAVTIPDNAIPIGLLNRLQQSGAFGRAQRMMALEGRPFDIGTVEPWDLMKRALDDRIGAAQRTGANNQARVLTGLKNELTNSIDAAVPQYAQARQVFAGQSDMLDALRTGQQAASPSVTREQVSQDYGQFGTEGERQMYRLGLGNAYRENLARASDTSDFAAKAAGTQQLRDKLAAVAPSPEALGQFNNSMDQAQQTFTEATRPTFEGWHRALESLDAKAGSGDNGAAAARDALEAHLSQNPDFARGRALQADYGRLGDAIDAGSAALRSGQTAVHPADFADQFATLAPAAQDAQRIAMRSDLDRSMGIRPNDLQAVKTTLQGPEGWNSAKIGTAFGPDSQTALEGSVDRNSVFRSTFNKVVDNSQTAQRTAASQMLDREASKGPLIPKNVTVTGLIGNAGESIIRAIADGRADFEGQKTRAAVGRILAMPSGPEREKVLGQLMRRSFIVDENGKRIGNAAALLTGGAGFEEARRRAMGRRPQSGLRQTR